jgi:hypothetical protein
MKWIGQKQKNYEYKCNKKVCGQTL